MLSEMSKIELPNNYISIEFQQSTQKAGKRVTLISSLGHKV